MNPHHPDPSRPVVGVGGVVIRGDRRVLLVRRAKPPGRGSWSLPGGKVRGGERLRDALVRELAEETGLTVQPGPLVEVFEILREGYHYVVLDYLCEVVGDPDAAKAADDAAELMWTDDLPDVSEDVRRVVRRGLELWQTAAEMR